MPASGAGNAACRSNASPSASTPRNVSSPAVSAMNAASQRGSARRSDGSHRKPERNRHDADEEADQRVAEEAVEARVQRLDRSSDLLRRLDPGRARHADGDRIVLDPVVRDHDRRRPEPTELGVAVDRERDDRVVDGHGGDRQIVVLRIRDAHLDLSGPELDAPDVELVHRRRVSPEQVDDRRAARHEQADDEREQHDRHERPQPPPTIAEGARRARFHQSTTSKKPIQPSSVNSDWCAWNMNRPVFAKSISMIPRCP